MFTEAIIMFLVGAVFLWGGLALSVLSYIRAARRDNGPATG